MNKRNAQISDILCVQVSRERVTWREGVPSEFASEDNNLRGGDRKSRGPLRQAACSQSTDNISELGREVLVLTNGKRNRRMGRIKESESPMCTSGTGRSAGAANVLAGDKSRMQCEAGHREEFHSLEMLSLGMSHSSVLW